MALSGLISLIVLLVVLGLALYLIENYVPLAPPFKIIIRVLVILFLFLYILSMFGLWSGFRT